MVDATATASETSPPPPRADRRPGFGGRALGGALTTGLAQGMRFLIQLLSVVVLSRLLAPTTFGLMAMLTPIIAFVTLFGDLGLSQATITARTISPQQMTSLFWVNVAVGLFLTVAVAAAAPLIAWAYGEPVLTWPLAVLATSILLASLGAQHKALANRQFRFHALAAIELLSLIAGFAASVVVALVMKSVWALVIGSIVTALVASVGQWMQSRWRPGRAAPYADVLHMLRFGRGLVGFNLANFVSRTADNVLIGGFAGPGALGLYDRAYRLLLFPLTQINGPVGRVVIPILSRLVDEPERYRAAYLRTIQQLLLVTMPGVAFLLSGASDLIPTVLGPQWTGSVPIFLWLGLAAAHQPMSATTGWLFVSQSRTGEFARWGLFVAVTSVAAFVVGLHWGAVGVAAAYGLSDLFVRAPVGWWWIGRRGPVQTLDLVRTGLPNALAFGAALGVSALLKLELAALAPIVRLAVQGPVCFLVYWLAMAAWPGGRHALLDVFRTVARARSRRRAITSAHG